MSLLKWKELAKSKSEFGNKINYVHNAITQHKIGQETSQESFAKVFKPVTGKLDDVIDSNLISSVPQKRKRPPREKKGPDYGINLEDEDVFGEDMNLADLFGDYVPPQQEKQLVPKPPTYEESLEDILKEKEIYVDPQYFPDPQELPPEYDEDEGVDEDDEVDYALDNEDEMREILEDIGIKSYEDVDYQLNEPVMTPKNTKKYLEKIIKEAKFKKNQLKGYKSHVTKQYNSGAIKESDKQMTNKRLDNTRNALNEYIKHYETKLQTMKGSGIKGRRRKRGGNVMFFNDTKQLLKKLELIVGEIIAGNTSINMRNMGVNILDTLLRMSTINRPQYTKLYNKYFKV